jgi:pimeloyl-ACP methyl ester carboxylesterase
MCRSAKLSMLLALLLIVALTACAPAATPTPPTATNPPPTDTPVPAPTYTPMPSPTVTPKPAPSEVKGKFDAGGVNLNLLCLGEGSPTVILDAGWNMDWMTWNLVMPKIKPHTRVCAYDRASVGHSDDQPGLRTSEQMAEQLHTLLANAKIEGPYLVVGHSLGGMNMLVFADRYRDEVAGLVLVESAHPDQVERFLAVLPTPASDEDGTLASLRKQTTVGVWANDPSFREPMDWDQTLTQVRTVKTLGSLPLVVLVDSLTSLPNLREWEAIGAPSDIAAKLSQVWLDLHKEQAALSSDSQLIQAEHSGHFLHYDEPQLVIDAILDLVENARQK